MARGKKTDDAVRAQVIAALLLGQEVTKVADDYKLPQQTVSDIKKAIPPEKFGELRSKKQGELDTLIWNLLVRNLVTLEIQSEHAGDKQWLNRQPAESLAVFHGVLADKTFRLLGAISGGTAEGQPAGEAAPGDRTTAGGKAGA